MLLISSKIGIGAIFDTMWWKSSYIIGPSKLPRGANIIIFHVIRRLCFKFQKFPCYVILRIYLEITKKIHFPSFMCKFYFITMNKIG